jgi:hypothetical protein
VNGGEFLELTLPGHLCYAGETKTVDFGSSEKVI